MTLGPFEADVSFPVVSGFRKYTSFPKATNVAILLNEESRVGEDRDEEARKGLSGEVWVNRAEADAEVNGETRRWWRWKNGARRSAKRL